MKKAMLGMLWLVVEMVELRSPSRIKGLEAREKVRFMFLKTKQQHER